jgi:hypothetical protein
MNFLLLSIQVGISGRTINHYYSDGKFCLATDSQIRIRYIEGFDLVTWMSEFVELYYFSYEYYERFGIFPFGERSHGSWGIIQTYQDFLMAKDEIETYMLMCFIKDQAYRGHHLCPCGRGKSLRNCESMKKLQDKIDMRRAMPVLERNCIHKRLAKVYSELYHDISAVKK